MIALRIGLLVGCMLHRAVDSLWISPVLAAGFGGAKPDKKRTKSNKKGGLAEMAQHLSPVQQATKDEKKLDKWGLPVPTLGDLFPPMAPDTELVASDAFSATTLTEIQRCLENHMDLLLDPFFDEKGNEKNGGLMQIKLLHKSPPVLTIDNFLTESECHELKNATQKAHKVDSATFTGALSSRTSTSWFCRFQDVPVLLAKANVILNMPLERMEEPQVVRYQKGQEFSWHYDEVPFPQLRNGGQRLATLLVYLNDVDAKCGGGTAFRDLLTVDGKPIIVQPRRGTALLFFPAFRDGSPDDRTLHQSEAMTCDIEKWIAQMWVHKETYVAVLPQGNSNVGAMSIMKKKIQELGYGDD